MYGAGLCLLPERNEPFRMVITVVLIYSEWCVVLRCVLLCFVVLGCVGLERGPQVAKPSVLGSFRCLFVLDVEFVL